MTDKEKILMYEASNLFMQRWFPFIMPSWLSEWNAKILARKFNRKWKNYQDSLKMNDYMKSLGYDGIEKAYKIK